MGSMRRRLAALEKGGKAAASGTGTSQRGWERYFHAHENARRELDGLEPLSELPYTEEDREDDQRTLEETIPAYRNSRSGETERIAAFLDEWESEVRDRLRKEG